MNNQKGFATLEVILVTAIISVLSFVAVPKISAVFDKVMLDYEMKIFCAEIERTRSLNRSASYSSEIFTPKIENDSKQIELRIDTDKAQYQLTSNEKFLGEPHKISAGIKIYVSEDMRSIQFDADGIYSGKSGTIILTSRSGDTAQIIFDSVGRWRGEKNAK